MSGMGHGVGCFTSPASIGLAAPVAFTGMRTCSSSPRAANDKPETKKAKNTRARPIYSRKCMAGVGACVVIRFGLLVCTGTLSYLKANAQLTEFKK